MMKSQDEKKVLKRSLKYVQSPSNTEFIRIKPNFLQFFGSLLIKCWNWVESNKHILTETKLIKRNKNKQKCIP